jgi:hypothetical protein
VVVLVVGSSTDLTDTTHAHAHAHTHAHTTHAREKIMAEIELNSKRAGLHGFETVKVSQLARLKNPAA